jgi:hypothetical protein
MELPIKLIFILNKNNVNIKIIDLLIVAEIDFSNNNINQICGDSIKIEMLPRTGPSSKPVLSDTNMLFFHGQRVNWEATTCCMLWINIDITMR